MLKLSRRQFLQSSCAAGVVAVVGIPVLTSGPEEAASLGRRIRVVSDFQIRGYTNGDGPGLSDRDFEIGQIVTKEDVDTTACGFDPESPGFFETLVEQGLGEFV